MKDANSLRSCLSASRVSSDGRLSNMIEEIASTKTSAKSSGTNVEGGATLIPTVLEYEDAKWLLGPVPIK